MSSQDLPSDNTCFEKNLKTMVSIEKWIVSEKTNSYREGELLPHFCYSFEGRMRMSSKSL